MVLMVGASCSALATFALLRGTFTAVRASAAAIGATAAAWASLAVSLQCPHIDAWHTLVSHGVPTLVVTGSATLLAARFLKPNAAKPNAAAYKSGLS
jgi:hypothetical protein